MTQTWKARAELKDAGPRDQHRVWDSRGEGTCGGEQRGAGAGQKTEGQLDKQDTTEYHATPPASFAVKMVLGYRASIWPIHTTIRTLHGLADGHRNARPRSSPLLALALPVSTPTSIKALGRALKGPPRSRQQLTRSRQEPRTPVTLASLPSQT
ncbi:hypothetical protein AOLI_G00100620 [Acnodon oligacanthus]